MRLLLLVSSTLAFLQTAVTSAAPSAAKRSDDDDPYPRVGGTPLGYTRTSYRIAYPTKPYADTYNADFSRLMPSASGLVMLQQDPTEHQQWTTGSVYGLVQKLMNMRSSMMLMTNDDSSDNAMDTSTASRRLTPQRSTSQQRVFQQPTSSAPIQLQPTQAASPVKRSGSLKREVPGKRQAAAPKAITSQTYQTSSPTKSDPNGKYYKGKKTKKTNPDGRSASV